MAGFGFSIGDIAAIGNFAWTVYKGCKSAGEEFRSITQHVNILQTELRELSDEASSPNSFLHSCTKGQRDELRTIMKGCKTDLKDLEKTLVKYRSLKTADPRTRDRFRFTAEKQIEMKAKLSTHAERLTLFLTHLNAGALGRIEAAQASHTNSFGEIKAKLESIHNDVRSGRKDPTLLSSMDDWGTLEQELLDDNITEVDVELNKDMIGEWLKQMQIDKGSGQSQEADSKGRYQATVEDAEEEETNDLNRHTTQTSDDDRLEDTVQDINNSRSSTPDTVVQDTPPRSAENDAIPLSTNDQRPKLEEYEFENQKPKVKKYEFENDRGRRETPPPLGDDHNAVPLSTRDQRPELKEYKSESDKGWQRCYNCKAFNELKEGCNHMTCRCTAQYCMVCAAPWKTCNCPWFTYEHLDDNDRENDFRSKSYDSYPSGRDQDHSRSSDDGLLRVSGRTGRSSSNPEVDQVDQEQSQTPPSLHRSKTPELGRYEYLPRPSPYRGSRDGNRGKERYSGAKENSSPYSPEGHESRRRVPFGESYPSKKESAKPSSDRSRLDSKKRRDKDERRDRSGKYSGHFEHDLDEKRGFQREAKQRDARANVFREDNKHQPNTPYSYGQLYDSYPHPPHQPQNYSSFSNPESIFAEFLRSGGVGLGDEGFGEFEGFAGKNPETTPQVTPEIKPEVTVVEKPLLVTLEELFKGTTKKMKVKNKTSGTETILEVPLKRGLLAGSKIKYAKIGSSQEDLHFIVKEKEHPLFTRERHNIRYTHTVYIKELLCGFSTTIPTIDGQRVTFSHPGPLQADHEERFPGLGMPISKTPDQRGDFIVDLFVLSPASLTGEQKAKLREILDECD